MFTSFEIHKINIRLSYKNLNKGQTIESNGANSAAGWHKTNSFMGKSFNRQNTGVIEEASHTGSSNGQMTFQTNRSETTSLMNPSDNK